MSELDKDNNLPTLKLPKRYERLLEESTRAGIDPNTVVEKVDEAAQRVDLLLKKIRDTGTGQFEVFFGKSGTGKTTFLYSLPKFFEGVDVYPIRKSELEFDQIANFIRSHYIEDKNTLRIYFFADRDNYRVDESIMEDFFEDMRVLFRENEGQILLIWPITKDKTSKELARIAWDVGADSILAIDTRGIYEFNGLSKDRYIEVANLTAISLNGDGIEAYGVPINQALELVKQSDTLGLFYAEIENHSSKSRDHVWSVLKEKARTLVWILVAGDDGKYLDSAVKGLVQGRLSRVDIELVLDILDDENNKSIYIEKWRDRRDEAAYLLRSLDVRVIPLHCNVALAAVRAFGNESVRLKLNKTSENESQAIKTVKNSALYKAILSEVSGESSTYISGRPPSQDTEDEYNRIQSTAKSADKDLNKALGLAIESALKDDGYDLSVVTEKRGLLETTLQPDIQIWKSEKEVICLEPTWRTSGKGVTDKRGNVEIDESQNTMTAGNIQKYFLDKVLDYITALKL